MGRTREFDDAAALKAMEAVFWRKGYEATSYADLMAASGLGKGSLYAAFGDKAALYLRALEAYIAREVGLMGQVLTTDGAPGADRLRAALDYAIEAVEVRNDRRGCFLCNTAVDTAASNHPEVKAAVEEAMQAATAAFAVAARSVGGGAGGGAGSGEAAGRYWLAVYLGVRVMAKAGADPAALREVRDAALSTLSAPT